MIVVAAALNSRVLNFDVLNMDPSGLPDPRQGSPRTLSLFNERVSGCGSPVEGMACRFEPAPGASERSFLQAAMDKAGAARITTHAQLRQLPVREPAVIGAGIFRWSEQTGS
tara:strand:+ start:282 stop:617 length:336 start_codon:yes stop_codon:yes gene_type:complete